MNWNIFNNYSQMQAQQNTGKNIDMQKVIELMHSDKGFNIGLDSQEDIKYNVVMLNQYIHMIDLNGGKKRLGLQIRNKLYPQMEAIKEQVNITNTQDFTDFVNKIVSLGNNSQYPNMDIYICIGN